MSDLRDLLEREAQRVHAEPDALDDILHRAGRRQRTRRITAGVVAIAIAAAGAVGAYRAFRPSAEQTPAIGGATEPFTGIWPEDTWEQHAAAQEAVQEGHQPWRLDPVMTAEAFVAEMLRWSDIKGQILGSDDPDTRLVEVTGSVPGRNKTLTEFVAVRTLGGKGTHQIWSPIRADSPLVDLHLPTVADRLEPGSGMYYKGAVNLRRGLLEIVLDAGRDNDTLSSDVNSSADPDRFQFAGGGPWKSELSPVFRVRVALDYGAPWLGMTAFRMQVATPANSQEVRVFFNSDLGDPNAVKGVDRLAPLGAEPLRAALEQLLRGPKELTSEEKNLFSEFSPSTVGLLNDVRIAGGVAHVDFSSGLRDRATGGSTSFGSIALLAQLNATVLQFPEIDQVRYSLDGDCAAFGEWLQTGDCTGNAQSAPARKPLPSAVRRTHRAIVRAARSEDWEALRDLIVPGTFTHSFGSSDDPIADWKEQQDPKKEIRFMVLQMLTDVLGTRPSRTDDGSYVWPAALAKDPPAWSSADIQELQSLGADDRDIETWREFGDYTGYRVGIAPDGTWLFFVAGD